VQRNWPWSRRTNSRLGFKGSVTD